MKVLLIENSRLYQLFLAEVFRKLGYTPVIVSSRSDAITQLESVQFEMICMNLYFDGANAIEFVNELRSYDANVSVLMLTSTRTSSLRERALQAGITEIIYKTTMQETRNQLSCFIHKREEPEHDRRRVLYVEDSRTQAVVISRILEEEMGLLIDHHTSAESALEKLKCNDYDLIITDVLLDGELSGLSLLRQVRCLPGEKASLPVLTITGHDDSARRLELLRAGTTDYITKPVLKEELRIRVHNLINNKLLMDRVLRQQEEMYRMAVTDQLTTCYNRHGFKEFALKYLANARRRSEPVSLLLLDLDFFKKINDSYGHDTGDKVLRAVGKLLMQTCRADDLIARYGGEEFIILLPNSSKSQGMRVAQKLRRRLGELYPEGIRLTVSIGVTVIEPHQELDMSVMFKAADNAVYRAKARGRNCVSFRKAWRKQ